MNTDLNVSQGTIAGREDTLVKSLRTAAGDAGDAAKDAAKDVVNTTAEGLGAARAKAEYKGQTYYFCSPGCKKAFDQEPEKYAGKQPSQPKHHSA